MSQMRAARFVELGRMECEMVELPNIAEGDLLVKTEMASICGSDLHTVFHGVMRTDFPQVPGYPGHEGVGEVVESKHPGFRPGDRVLCCPAPLEARTFAELQRIKGGYCIKLPEYKGPVSHLLMAQQLGTVIFALRQRPVDLVGRNVMVQGQGSAGLFFAYLAKRAGAAKVIVSDLSEARLAASRALGGADVALKSDGKRGSAHIKEAVLEQTGGEGVDFLVEAVGSKVSLLEAVDLVRIGADMLMFGLPDTGDVVNYNFHDFFRKKLVMSSTYGAQEEPGRVSFKMALDMIASGEIDVSPLVSHVFPVEQVQEAMLMAHERSDNALKVSLSF